MVDEGMPLDGTADYGLFSSGSDVLYDAKTFVKALTWDYVSSNPHQVASTEEIKRALITYGPIVTTVVSDDCLKLYGGGVLMRNKIGNYGRQENAPTRQSYI